jgi:transposase
MATAKNGNHECQKESECPDTLIARLLERQRELEEENAWLRERNNLLQAILFGRRTEKRAKSEDPALQPLLFQEEPATDQSVEETVPPVPTKVSEHTRGKPGRRPLPADLPRVDVFHDLLDSEKTCACGCSLTRIGEEISERLDIIPAKIQVVRHIRYKYACRGCEGTDSGETGAVRTAELPPQIIPQGIVTAGLLAHVAVSKFVDALPLYRQEQQFLRLGLDISRGTLANWMLLVGMACSRLFDLLLEDILAGPVINMDETEVQVLREPGRANTAKSYMWVCRGGPPDKPGVIFRYEPTRSGSVPTELLRTYQGYLQTDGYIGYEAIGLRPGIRHLGCWAHVRRKFVEVTKGTRGSHKKGVADEVLNHIGGLYRIEAESAPLSPEARQALRQELAWPVLEKIKTILDERSMTTPPKSLLGKAISYALNQWPLLTVYLEDGRLSPDNNLAENAIRPFAVGRKNWLFSGSPRGAHASAILYSLIETAKANDIEPYQYLRFLFSEVPLAKTDAELRVLLPQHLDRTRLQTQ